MLNVKVIHRPLSKITQFFTFSNIFYSETTGPVEYKFYVEPPWDEKTKYYSNGLGHMTKMAAMPI